MINRVVKWFLLLWPVVFMFWVFNWSSSQRQKVDDLFSEANGHVWETGDTRITVQVSETDEGEILRYDIEASDGDNEMLFKDSFTINRDMFGGGFVKAMQVDDDEELEIVAWGAHEKDNCFYLDFDGPDAASDNARLKYIDRDRPEAYLLVAPARSIGFAGPPQARALAKNEC